MVGDLWAVHAGLQPPGLPRWSRKFLPWTGSAPAGVPPLAAQVLGPHCAMTQKAKPYQDPAHNMRPLQPPHQILPEPCL